MHILGGTLALICILWNFPKIMEAFKIDWQIGTSLLTTLAIGGYLHGSIMSGAINLAYTIFKNKQQKKTSFRNNSD